MSEEIKVAVMGCGHIGYNAVQGIKRTQGMRLIGVIDLPAQHEKLKASLPGVQVVANVDELSEVPEVVILTVPSRTVELVAPGLLAKGISTVDCFDMHGDPFMALKRLLDPIAKKNDAVAIMGSGVDPGTCTMVRAIFQLWAPTGLTYVNYGPGMSMGHTVAVRSYPGVENALSITRPGRPGVHQRDVYIQLKEGADFEELTRQLKQDSYFVHDDVRFFKVENVEELIDMGHKINVERKGVACGIDNQLLSFDSKFHNPASTAQVLVSSVFAARKMTPGAHIMLEVPLLHFLPFDVEEAIRRLV